MLQTKFHTQFKHLKIHALNKNSCIINNTMVWKKTKFYIMQRQMKINESKKTFNEDGYALDPKLWKQEPVT